MPQVRADLEALVRIPSVSASSFDQSQVARSAEAVAALLRAEGLEVEIVTEGGRPAVIGHVDGPEGAPTVTLYAHHDVQPPGDEADWDTAPFEPTERDGRLYGRGAADDKAGVMAHVAALRAHAGALPVGLTIFVEGEEESGSPSLETILARHGDRLAADAIVIADSTNWAIGSPALTTTLRGGAAGRRAGAHPRPLGALGDVWRRGTRRRHRPRAPAREPARRRRLGGGRGAGRGRGGRPRLRRGALPRGERPARGGRAHRRRVDPVAPVDPAVDHDHRHRRHLDRQGLQHPGRLGRREDLGAPRPDPGPRRGVRARQGAPAAATPRGEPGSRSSSRRAAPVSRPTPTARSTTRRAPPSPTRGAPSRSTSGSVARSRSSRASSSASRRRRSSSRAWRTPTRVPTGPTSRCTSGSSRRCASPRPSSSPAWVSGRSPARRRDRPGRAARGRSPRRPACRGARQRRPPPRRRRAPGRR